MHFFGAPPGVQHIDGASKVQTKLEVEFTIFHGFAILASTRGIETSTDRAHCKFGLSFKVAVLVEEVKVPSHIVPENKLCQVHF